MRIGKQRAQRRFVAGSRVGEPPPREREIHALGVKQRQPVLGQRCIGDVVARSGSTQPELGALSAQQMPAVVRGERRRCTSLAIAIASLVIVGQQRQQRLGEPRKVPSRDVGLVAEGIAAVVVDRAEHRGRDRRPP